ncbi:MAG: hypothetical protein ABWZ82_11485 [Candidatus Limnocylindrales bacterium]
MTFDLYVWKGPRDLDASAADELVKGWSGAADESAASPFEPSTDVAWFYRELMKDEPSLEVVTDASPGTSRLPIWLQTEDPPPAQVVAMRLGPATGHEDITAIGSLAAKYDLVLFDARHARVREPLAEMAEYASATFWWRGATQAAIAGGGGAALAVVAYVLSIPLLSGVLILVGGFLFVMAVFTFVHEGRQALGRTGRQT